MVKSQASPTPSLSASAWLSLAIKGQLSSQFVVCPPVQGSLVPSPSLSGTASLSSFGSQTLPEPSPSVLSWSGLKPAGQLSHTSPSLSPSVSSWLAFFFVGQLSQTLPTPSLPSLSVSAWSGFDKRGQLSVVSVRPSLSSSLSQASPIESWSESAWNPISISAAVAVPSPFTSQKAGLALQLPLLARQQLSHGSPTPSLSARNAAPSVWLGLHT